VRYKKIVMEKCDEIPLSTLYTELMTAEVEKHVEPVLKSVFLNLKPVLTIFGEHLQSCSRISHKHPSL